MKDYYVIMMNDTPKAVVYGSIKLAAQEKNKLKQLDYEKNKSMYANYAFLSCSIYKSAVDMYESQCMWRIEKVPFVK